MQVHPSRARYATLFVLMLASLGFNGCAKPLVQAGHCKDQTVTIDFSQIHGVDIHHNAVYVCTGNTVTWNPGPKVQSFTITFVDYPFGGSAQTFDQNHNTSPQMPAYTDLMVFKYSVTGKDTNGNTYQFDPHVVGGGGLTN